MAFDNLELLNKAFSLADDPTYSIPREIAPNRRTVIEDTAAEIRSDPAKRRMWEHELQVETARREARRQARSMRSQSRSGGKRRRSRRRRGKTRH
jgi:hypothetical protein